MELLVEVLHKIARRYQLKGVLSGTMKLGQHVDRQDMAELGNFFGLDPLRVNKKEEVHLHFNILCQNGTMGQWLGKISETLGVPLQAPDPEPEDRSDWLEKILASLTLAHPSLKELFTTIWEDQAGLAAIMPGKSEPEVRAACFKTAETILFLLENKKIITISDLGAQFHNNSKALRQGELRRLLLKWLALVNPETANEETLLGRYHVVHDRLTVSAVLYGPVIYEKNGRRYDWIDQLYQAGEAATLGWANMQDMDRIYFRDNGTRLPDLVTCENEAPFSGLMQQKEERCIIFTRGFPSSGVQKLYQLLAPLAARCLHWGDSDPAGLRIAALLHGLHPLHLYRCDLATLQRSKAHLIALSQKQKESCRHILTSQPDFPFQEEILFCLENGWLEQESWEAEKKDSLFHHQS